MIPNIPPKLFSLSAVVVGYLLIDDATANEQNAMGNWLMLVAQVLSTNAFFRQVRQERGLENYNSTESGKTKSSVNEELNNKDMVAMLEKMIKAMQKEINDLKKDT